ncbi:sugar transferase [Microbacter margulisiae]|uniref:Exopolysaccharide biosynthesis polyprenyl glycosylphosphotransferase n=1 Tax=Microbacter margulisiae TaxID=1350067 RepID=A0A7W5DPR4_9PORP|nr:sugar transferase [Microbacter margulisiae]MBB3186043.1 exopolysaccharide biosynthesis polyprenyl glycosylphosphotransferase [Microbacter margulisiae]
MNRQKQKVVYIIADMGTAVASWVIFFVYHSYVSNMQTPVATIKSLHCSFWGVLLVYPFYCVLIHYLSGYYLRPFQKQPLLEFVTTFMSSLVIALTIFFLLLFRDVVISNHYYLFFSVLFLAQLGLTYFVRIFITHTVKNKIRKGKLSFNTLIIGTGINAQAVFSQLQLNQHKNGNKVLGFVDPGQALKENNDPKSICSLSDIASVIEEHHITELFIVADNSNEDELFDIVNQLLIFPVSIKVLPRVYEFLTARIRINSSTISPYIEITALSMPDWQLCTKRFLDIVISFFVLVFFSPVFLYLLIRVKRETPGVAIYRQERIGLHGKPFQILKFRTMYSNAENGVPQLTSKQDQRITPFGAFMRRYRLDELPQFYNVLKGDMSIVGPRPERQYFINQIMREAPYYCLLYNVRPGLTSWGPIKVGYTDMFEKMVERLQYDILYLENMSLLSDMQILLFTLSTIIKGKGW